MTDVTLETLALQIHVTVDLLVRQFADAGMNKSPLDFVSQKEKEALLVYLNNNYVNTSDSRLTLQRKIHSILNVSSNSGKRKQVKVEVRKKRVYVRYKSIIVDEEDNATLQSISDVSFQKQDVCLDNTLKNFTKNNKDEIIDISPRDSSVLFQENIISKEIHDNLNHEKITKEDSKDISISEDMNVSKDILENKVDYLSLKESTNIVPCIKEASKSNLLQSRKNDFVDSQTVRFRHITKSAGSNKDDNKKFEVDRYSRNKVSYKSKYRARTRSCKTTKRKKNHHLLELHEDIIENEYTKSVVMRVARIQERRSNVLVQGFNKPISTINRDIIIGETITVSELANKMAVKASQVIKAMMNLGVIATINHTLDQETAHLIAEDMGHNVILRRENELEEFVLNDRDVVLGSSLKKSRPPIVTVMGHVDHGKTSLLDYIRSTKVVSSEKGGITQRVGAYYVNTDRGIITFIDTPGHEAFTAMRSRGAKVTDIIVLVVAADDGVMLQTIESIHHAKTANVPVVVAINKVDKYESNPEKIKSDLLKHGIVSEEFGGDNQFICISAKTGFGVDHLLDAILLQAEMLELKSYYDCMATGIIIESFIDKGRGPVANILVREGTLRRGDIVLCGAEYGKIRAMHDHVGQDVFCAGPSMPVEVFGLSGAPITGDILTVVRDEKKAREVALYRQEKYRDVKLSLSNKKLSVDSLLTNMNNNHGAHLLNIVLKTDTRGSAEAIINSLHSLFVNGVKVRIVSFSVGEITETDAILASTVNAVLIAFNVRADNAVRQFIKTEGIDCRYYFVIYSLINDIKLLLSNLLKPKYKENILGHAEIRNVFRSSSKLSTVVGCMIIDGYIRRNSKIRILRHNVVVHEGELESLRRFKEDITEVRYGMECGMIIKNYSDLCVGDVIEVFEKIALKNIK